MAGPPMDPKELGFYFALAQVGLEMVAPLGLGLALDYWTEWTAPWGLIGGTILGFVGGLAHMVIMANRQPPGTSKPPKEAP